MTKRTPEQQAHDLARRYPMEAHAGWLLACAAPANIARGARLLAGMTDPKDMGRTIEYRNYCIGLYAAGRHHNPA